MKNPTEQAIGAEHVSALHRRLVHLTRYGSNWKTYIGRKYRSSERRDRDPLVELRHIITAFIKHEAQQYDKHTDHSHDSHDYSQDYVVGSAYVQIPELSLSKRANKLFAIDFGSINDTSNVDITFVNAPDAGLLKHLTRRLTERFGPTVKSAGGPTDGIDITFIQRVFDISLYLNSFLVNLGGRVCYVNVPRKSVDRKRQRTHSKHRLGHRLAVGRAHENDQLLCTSLDALLRQRDEALLARRPYDVLELTSRSSYCGADDAYHSQGAFLHVLIEIQAGIALELNADDYLDSAYDNLGMLRQAAFRDASQYAKETSVGGMRTGGKTGNGRGTGNAKTNGKGTEPETFAFSKYVARIANALGHVECTSEKPRAAAGAERLRRLVRYFDEVSFSNAGKKHASCSVGRLSKTITAKNDENLTFSHCFERACDRPTSLRHAFPLSSRVQRNEKEEESDAPYQGSCPFFVPHRTLDIGSVSLDQFIAHVCAELDDVAKSLR